MTDRRPKPHESLYEYIERTIMGKEPRGWRQAEMLLKWGAFEPSYVVSPAGDLSLVSVGVVLRVTKNRT